MGWRIGGVALLAAIVASCGGPPPVRTLERGASSPPGAGASLPEGGSARAAPRPSRPIPADAPTPDDIAGKTPILVRGRLGAPSLTRREPPAEVWQYAGGDCVIDIVFYPPPQAEGLRAAHLASRDLDGRPLPPADCLGLLAAERDGP